MEKRGGGSVNAFPDKDVVIERKTIGMWLAKGMPKGQPRPRAFSRGGRAAVYDPGTAEGWKGCVAVACASLEGRCLHQPLSVALTFYMPRPKAHFRTNGKLKDASPVYLHDSKPDIDNLTKAVLDALTGIRAWLDDDQVCELTVRKHWEIPGSQSPGCSIRISELREVLS